MMKGKYIVFDNRTQDFSIGENRKIMEQIKSFNDAGISFEVYKMLGKKQTPVTKALIRVPFTNLEPIWKYDSELSECDFIYFRRPPFLNIHFYRTLKCIKRENPRIVIMMEIPTFPYDKELIYRTDGLPLNYPILWKDRLTRPYIHNVVDYLVLPSESEKVIWKCPVLHINNGFDLTACEVRRPVDNDSVDLVAVAMFKEWHGYERIIEAMHQYNGNRKVVLHLVGEGTEIPVYKELVEQYGLEDNVVFYGRKRPEEMNDVFDIADIGLCSFGAYKKDLFFSRELKSREYLAKGLPIASAVELDVLKPGDYGYLQFPNDSSPIDMSKIISFYDDLYSRASGEDIARKMRSIAEKNFDMADCMRSVIDIMKQ